jgi:hypothetical protein
LGLWHLWCVAECAAPTAVWTNEMIEDADALPRELPRLPPTDCRASGWDADLRPSLALGPAGRPSFAFENP